MGNRIAKHTIKNGIRTSTYYSLDAQGNTMAVYKYGEQEVLKIEERMIYGSSRLGMEQLGTNISFSSLNSYSSVDFSTFNPINDLTGLCSEAGVLSVINEHLANQFELYDYELNDFNNDGAIDLKVNNTIQGQGNDFTANFSTQLMINTTPGESYDVYFDLDMNAYVCSFAVYECQGSNVNLQVNFTEEGSYMMSFVASSSLSRLKWFTLSNKDGEEFEASDITISSLSDQKLPEANQNNGVEFFDANVIMYSDYYPFGMFRDACFSSSEKLSRTNADKARGAADGLSGLMPGRNSEGGYRYGFNGMEKDDEVKGISGTSYDFGARMYDSRVGRWLSVDPLAEKYPDISPYVFVANSVLQYVDPDGRKIVVPEELRNEARIALASVIRTKANNAGRRFRPQITLVNEEVVFASNRDTRRAQRFVNRNLESTDPADRELAQIYNSILSDAPEDKVEIKFGETSTRITPEGAVFSEFVERDGSDIIIDEETFDNIKESIESTSNRQAKSELIREKRKTYISGIKNAFEEVFSSTESSQSSSDGERRGSGTQRNINQRNRNQKSRGGNIPPSNTGGPEGERPKVIESESQ